MLTIIYMTTKKDNKNKQHIDHKEKSVEIIMSIYLWHELFLSSKFLYNRSSI